MIIVIKWPKSKEEAKHYLAGLIVGDGTIEKYRIEIYDKNNEFLEMVEKAVIKKFFEKYITRTKIEYRKHVNNYRLRIYGKRFVEEIKPLCENIIINPDFVRGFFDAEGSIWYNPNIIAEITNKNKEILEEIQRLLRQYKINSKIHKDRTTYKLRITSMRKFIEIIGLRHPRHILKIYLHSHIIRKC